MALNSIHQLRVATWFLVKSGFSYGPGDNSQYPVLKSFGVFPYLVGIKTPRLGRVLTPR